MLVERGDEKALMRSSGGNEWKDWSSNESVYVCLLMTEAGTFSPELDDVGVAIGVNELQPPAEVLHVDHDGCLRKRRGREGPDPLLLLSDASQSAMSALV